MPASRRDAASADGSFASGRPALDQFPFDRWARLVARHARQTLPGFGDYQHPAGHAALRAAIAAHIGVARGVRCTADQIIVTAGAQGAFDLVVRTLLNPGEPAWLENPGYFGAWGALVVADARVMPIPVDEQGLDVAAGRRRSSNARLAVTTPSHQFPTGVTMSLGRRLALLDWARQADSWILEDDYDSEFRFSGRPLEALQSLDQANRVIYVGSFSKVLFPTLRLGYLVAPPALVGPLLATRRYIDGYVPLLEQMALADFIREGHLARHVRRMRKLYHERRDCLCFELQAQLGDLLDVHVPEAGMQLVGWLPVGLDDQQAAGLAARAGVKVAPISQFALEPLPRGGLLFGFAGTDVTELQRSVRALADALRKL
jgi:GntR family transcriptional regulator/MocR family aminotransferase